MKNLLIHWRKLAHLMAAAILLLAFQSISLSALGVNHPDFDGHLPQAIEHHHVLDHSLCFHEIDRKGPTVHCHTVAAAARAIVPDGSPDPRDRVADDGVIAALPRPASSHLPSSGALPPRPPAFILFANFRS